MLELSSFWAGERNYWFAGVHDSSSSFEIPRCYVVENLGWALGILGEPHNIDWLFFGSLVLPDLLCMSCSHHPLM